MEIKVPGRCEAGQPKDFVEGMFVHYYEYGKGRDPEDPDVCEQTWAQVDYQGTRKMPCHTLSLLFQSFSLPTQPGLTQCPNPSHSFFLPPGGSSVSGISARTRCVCVCVRESINA